MLKIVKKANIENHFLFNLLRLLEGSNLGPFGLDKGAWHSSSRERGHEVPLSKRARARGALV